MFDLNHISDLRNHRWTAATTLALLCWTLVGGAHLQAKNPDPPKPPKHVDKFLAEHLKDAPQEELIPVIVTVKEGGSDTVTAVLKKHGQQKKQDFSIVPAFSVALSSQAILDLADNSDVLGLSYDAPIAATTVAGLSGNPKNTTFSLKTTLGLAGTNLTGKNVTVAIIDSGIYPAPDFGNRIVKFLDFTQGGASVAPLDPYGHGTHIAGIIGGAAGEAPGLAANVKLIGLRVLDGLGNGSTSNVIAAIQWATNNRLAYKIDIINLSLGHQIQEAAATDPLVQAVEAAVRAGIVVVVSAGNNGISETTGLPGYTGILSPGNAPSAITVGAERTFDTNTHADDLVADFSSRGPSWFDAFAKPDLVAPGQHILATSDKSLYLYTTYPTLRGKSAGDKEFLYLSGTSMSAAVVSGSVALMLEAARSKFPDITTGGVVVSGTPKPNAIKAMLMNSAFKLGDANGIEYDTLTQGAGALNMAGGITLAQSLDSRVPVGSNWLVSGLVESSSIDGQTITWANRIMWNDKIVWGNAIYANNTAWGTSTVWGTNLSWSSGAVLNGLAVSGNQAVWANQIVWANLSVVANSKQIVWGNSKQIVWGNTTDANSKQIVWGNDIIITASENSLGVAPATK